jgi:diguanylate cyclase (GGDEF)-like protein
MPDSLQPALGRSVVIASLRPVRSAERQGLTEGGNLTELRRCLLKRCSGDVSTLSGVVESHSELLGMNATGIARPKRSTTTPVNSAMPTRRLKQRLSDGQVGLFTTFALVMLAAVLVIGLALGLNIRGEANQRGLAEGRTEALLMAQTAVGPIFDGRPLSQGLSASETKDMDRLVKASIRSRHVLRLRLRDLAGKVVFSSDGSGLHETVEHDDQDQIADAASGSIVARLTTLDADNPTGPRGPAAVEVYMPLIAGRANNRVGVLEVYLPYAPIRVDVEAGLSRIYRDLTLGLGGLYVLLFLISYVVGRRLRKQVKITSYVGEHDALTDLPNRTLFQRQAEAILSHARQGGRRTIVAVVDLDRFKEINDTLGHVNGDALLVALSATMRSYLPTSCALARLGGDEFGVVFTEDLEADELLLGLRDAIAAEVLVSEIPISVESSIGYAESLDDGETISAVLQLAEIAMYSAKERHTGIAKYAPDQNHFVASDLALMADLRQAIDNDELTLHYQPQISIASGEVEAVEALVRWNHPQLGLLYPDQFIMLAEKTDLIDRLTDWVLHRALSDADQFRSEAGALRVSVNISARNLNKSGFAAKVIDALVASGLSPGRLIVEVTETALMADPEGAARALTELSAAGVQLSVDDFGVGQTSLSYLSSLPITELKIDRMFITDMNQNHGHAAIVRSIIDLGHNLGFRVVGEGVEDQSVLSQLALGSCDVAQGYYFARPMAVEGLITWLAKLELPQLVKH